jgi:hypothetical protein
MSPAELLGLPRYAADASPPVSDAQRAAFLARHAARQRRRRARIDAGRVRARAHFGAFLARRAAWNATIRAARDRIAAEWAAGEWSADPIDGPAR